MTKKRRTFGNRSGATLLVVMGLTALGVVAASCIASGVSARARLSSKQVALEQAFYLASAGAERAASNVANGNETSTTLSGKLGSGCYTSVVTCTSSSTEVSIDVVSTGYVNGVKRTVKLTGLQHASWARYALWYNSESVSPIYMVPGEVFRGPVASKPQLHFHNKDLATKGQVHFYDSVASAASSIDLYSSAVSPIFDKGISLNATIESVAAIDFSSLLSSATSAGLVLNGPTTIVANGTTLTISNTSKGWTNKAVPIPANGLIYVKTVTTTSGWSTTTSYGDITVSAPNGLDGRLTLVADDDINIVGHIRYTANPTNSVSDDALGLIAKQDVVVTSAAPNNLEIYAHIICQNGGFGVASYSSGSSRGTITVYGGIVNAIRNPVGTTTPSGYIKNYIYDKRFSKTPPPSYPELPDVLEWTAWEG
jgi:Tfp pilus assembly protein PilV